MRSRRSTQRKRSSMRRRNRKSSGSNKKLICNATNYLVTTCITPWYLRLVRGVEVGHKFDEVLISYMGVRIQYIGVLIQACRVLTSMGLEDGGSKITNMYQHKRQ